MKFRLFYIIIIVRKHKLSTHFTLWETGGDGVTRKYYN